MVWYAGRMETNEISLHQVRVYRFVWEMKDWVTNAEIARGAAVAARTARLHTRRFVAAGLFDQIELFPGHSFRIAAKPESRNKAYALRLAQAAEAFGLELSV